jgi:hypothetical protein
MLEASFPVGNLHMMSNSSEASAVLMAKYLLQSSRRKIDFASINRKIF